MRAPSAALLTALPVLASGFQLQSVKMPPNANLMMSATPEAAVRKRPASASKSAPQTATAPLHYTEDANAVAVDARTLQLQQPPLSLPRGGAAAALLYVGKSLPIAALVSALCVAFARFLAPLSSPAAQGVKLVYAGAIAGIVSRTFCAPIEMVSTVMMCRGDAAASMWEELGRTWRREGFKGMFKGNGANCLKVAPSRGTQFLVYEFIKRKMVLAGFGVAAAGAAGAGTLNAGARLCAGGIAGMVAASIVYPLEVVKTMLTLYPEKCRSIGSALKYVYASSGLGGLYRGLGPTLVAMFPYVGVEFMVYETLKKRWEAHVGPVGTAALLLMGAAGGAAAQASAHPLDVIRRRMQMQSMNAEKKKDDDADEDEKYSNMFAGLYHVGKTEGVHVLFNGLGPACFEKIPSTAIGYFIYEFLKVTLKVSSV